MTMQYPIICLLVVLGVIAPVAVWPQAPDAPADWPLPRGDIHATGTSRAPGPTAPVIQWRDTERLGMPTAPPVADRTGTVYLAHTSSGTVTVRALSVADGSERWVLRRGNREIVSGLAVADGLLYAAGADSSSLVVLDPTTGQVLSELTGVAERSRRWLAGVVPRPQGGLLLSGHTQLRAIGQDLSATIWTWTDPRHEVPDVLGLGIASVTHTGQAVIAAAGGSLYALRLSDGQVQWQYDSRGEYSVGLYAAVDEQNHVLWVGRAEGEPGRGQYVLVCLEGDSGELLWSQDFSGTLPGAPVISNGRVLLLAGSGLFCWSAADGEPLWSSRIPDDRGRGLPEVNTGPVIDANGRVYLIAGSHVFCFSLHNGEEVFRKDVAPWLVHFILPGDGSLLVVDYKGVAYCLRDEAQE